MAASPHAHVTLIEEQSGGHQIGASAPLLLFDIDGTILRGGTEVHRAAFTHAFREVYGLPLTLDGMSAAGRTDTWLLVDPLRRSGLPDVEIWAKMPLAFSAMQDYVERNLGDLSEHVLPGVRAVLADLRQEGCLLGLLTGNLSRIAFAKMAHAGLAEYFSTGGFGEESVERADLVPVALEHARATFGLPISPEQTVLIGDTPLDIAAGHVHGTLTCGVATGTFSSESLRHAGAHLVLESLADSEHAVAEILLAGVR